jgi:hypothetical protein
MVGGRRVETTGIKHIRARVFYLLLAAFAPGKMAIYRFLLIG